MEPGFSKYTLDDLYDIEERLGKGKYPERYERLIAMINNLSPPQEDAKSSESDD